MIEIAVPQTARVVKWQTRTFEGRMPKGVGVQVPPRAFKWLLLNNLRLELEYRSSRFNPVDGPPRICTRMGANNQL